MQLHTSLSQFEIKHHWKLRWNIRRQNLNIYCSHQFHSTVSDRVRIRKTVLDCMPHFYMNVRPPSTSSATSQNQSSQGGRAPLGSFLNAELWSASVSLPLPIPHPKKSKFLTDLGSWALKISKDRDSVTSLSHTVSNVWLPAQFQKKKVVNCLDSISCISICTHCLLSCQQALLRNAWFHLPCTCFFM